MVGVARAFLLCFVYLSGLTQAALCPTSTTGESFTISSACSIPPGNYTYGTLTLTSATVTLQCDPPSGQFVFISADSISVDASSVITSTGQGYTWAQGGGPGAGLNSSPYSAGGYGGIGGGTGDPAKVRAYGRVKTPTLPGSAGGNDGGAGGGIVYLNLATSIQVEGFITANGADCSSSSSLCGGGSGGSIVIITPLIEGEGQIQANGGAGSPDGYGGGGGRIHFEATTDHFYQYYRGTLIAGGGAGLFPGGPGTILDNVMNTLSINNGNIETPTYINSFQDNIGAVAWLVEETSIGFTTVNFLSNAFLGLASANTSIS